LPIYNEITKILYIILKKEMKLLKKMRRRSSLSMARETIIKDLGKEAFVKEDSWKLYFNAFTNFTFVDWKTIFDGTKGEKNCV
jgi:NADPH-dependent 7-cyano-7-deazaguanine reductase QueF-like protein